MVPLRIYNSFVNHSEEEDAYIFGWASMRSYDSVIFPTKQDRRPLETIASFLDDLG